MALGASLFAVIALICVMQTPSNSINY